MEVKTPRPSSIYLPAIEKVANKHVALAPKFYITLGILLTDGRVTAEDLLHLMTQIQILEQLNQITTDLGTRLLAKLMDGHSREVLMFIQRELSKDPQPSTSTQIPTTTSPQTTNTTPSKTVSNTPSSSSQSSRTPRRCQSPIPNTLNSTSSTPSTTSPATKIASKRSITPSKSTSMTGGHRRRNSDLTIHRVSSLGDGVCLLSQSAYLKKLSEKKRGEEDMKLVDQINALGQDSLLEECQICLDRVPTGEVYHLKGCLHSFHRRCIGEHFCALVDKGGVNLRCPINECQYVIGENEIQRLCGPQRTKRWAHACLLKLSQPKC